jgi:NADH dehydrogenase (ubiquinone) Fe-S protein 3
MLLWIHYYFGTLIAVFLPKYIKQVLIKNFELVLKTPYMYIYPLVRFLKLNNFTKLTILTDVICCDTLKKNRFVIIYHLLNITSNVRIRLYVEIKEVYALYSLTSIFKNANWLEREVWDLFGVFFEKHPNLKRILNDYNYSWHPLRKDFPLTGYTETIYVEIYQKVCYTNLELAQEYKELFFSNFWNLYTK